MNETVEVFETNFDGQLLYSGSYDTVLTAQEEVVREIEIPPVGLRVARLAVRLTATSTVNDTDYVDVSEFTIDAGTSTIPTVSGWGMIALVLLVLIAGAVVFGQRRAADC
ncbi:MAG: hypothetical protein KJ749_08315 [Planctomycetes bacterium]|nr:hypothetical protein [Planctomycetota bacterium]